MKKKLSALSAWCFLLALALFALSFVMFHYLTASGFTTVFQQEPGKPFVTELVAELGVLFLFGSILSLLVRRIFFRED